MPVDPTSDFPPAAARIAAAVETSLDTMVAAAVEAIWEQVPAYRDSSDDQLREDVAAHVGAVFGVFLTGMTGRRPARRADFAVTREQAMRQGTGDFARRLPPGVPARTAHADTGDLCSMRQRRLG